MQSLLGFTIILLMQAAGEALVRWLHLPVPGTIIGMALLLLALAWVPIRTPVQACADFLLAHMAVLFVPINVGIMIQLPLLQQYGGKIAIVLVVSTLVGVGATALAMQAMMRRPDDQEAASVPPTAARQSQASSPVQGESLGASTDAPSAAEPPAVPTAAGTSFACAGAAGAAGCVNHATSPMNPRP